MRGDDTGSYEVTLEILGCLDEASKTSVVLQQEVALDVRMSLLRDYACKWSADSRQLSVVYREFLDGLTFETFKICMGEHCTLLSKWCWDDREFGFFIPLDNLVSCQGRFIYAHPFMDDHAGFADSSGSTLMDFQTLEVAHCFWHPSLESRVATVSHSNLERIILQVKLYNLDASRGRQVEGVFNIESYLFQCAAWHPRTPELVFGLREVHSAEGKLFTMSCSSKLEQMDYAWPLCSHASCDMAASVHGLVAIAADGRFQVWNLKSRQQMFATCFSPAAVTSHWSPCGTFLVMIERPSMDSPGRGFLYSAGTHAPLPAPFALLANIESCTWDISGARLLCQQNRKEFSDYYPVYSVIVLDFAAA